MRTEARTTGSVTPPLATPVAIRPLAPPVPVSRYVVFLLIAATGLGWDLWSKHWVFGALGCPGQSAWEWTWQPLVRFRLHTNFNHGALWGMGQGMAWLFATLSVAAVVGILTYLFVFRAARQWWLTVALGLVTAGALGNLYDRTGMHGWRDDNGPVYAVRDFLDFQFFETFDWAIFNFADTYLVTGAIMLVLYSFKPEPVATAASAPPSEPRL
jgi:signal peptidase II